MHQEMHLIFIGLMQKWPPRPPNLLCEKLRYGGEASLASPQLTDANSSNGLRPKKSPRIEGLGGECVSPLVLACTVQTTEPNGLSRGRS
jgi:hypothetical protein